MRKKNKYYLFLIIPIFIGLFKEVPAQATSSDAITLESISAVSSTVLTSEDIVMQIQVAVPSGYSWDPNVSALGGKIKVQICPDSLYQVISGIPNCNYGTQQAKYSLTNISNLNTVSDGLFDIKTFRISGLASLNVVENYKLMIVRIPAANIPNRDEMHYYSRGKTYATDDYGNLPYLVPTFINGDVSYVNSLPTPTPTPTPAPSPSDSESATPSPTPTVSETSTPTPTPSSSPSEISTSVVATASNSNSITKNLTPIAIQSSGVAILKTPNKNGDLTWKKAEDIVTKNSEWKLKRNNSAHNGNFIETFNSNSPIKVNTKGDAFTLRFIAGSNRGSIQINVDGKKLALFSTKASKSKIKVKSWIGIGSGKHTIEIIPIINPGQSVGIDAIQVAKAV